MLLLFKKIGQKASFTALVGPVEYGLHKTIDQRKIRHTIHPVFFLRDGARIGKLKRSASIARRRIIQRDVKI